VSPVAQEVADPASNVLSRARGLVEDLELDFVRGWKADHPGRLAIGHMPVYTPRVLLEALGCLPVGVFGGGDQIDVIRGDSYFQSYICRIPRSTIELGLSGHLDALDGMLFPSICDVIRNLSGMWQILFPDKFAAYLDLPQNFDPELGGKFYAGDLHRIAAELVERGAAPPTDARLREAIHAENSRRDAIGRLDALRKSEPWRVRASEAYLVIRAGTLLPASHHMEMIGAFLEAVTRREPRPYDNVRVVLQGSFCEQPPLDLIRSLEKAGCDIVSDDFQLGMRMIQGPIHVAPGQDPVEAIALAYCNQGAACASRYVADDEKGRALIEEVHAQDADGVIFAAASFCDPALLDQPMLEAALDREGIPHTSLKFAENTGQFTVIREQAGAFSDSVKLWGSA
jgi:benzoyl-CoA reductase subunit C